MQVTENKQLCPSCQTGKDSYILDEREPCCPYLSSHNGKGCTRFKPLKGIGKET